METKKTLPHLKVNQIWRRQRRMMGHDYDMFFRLKRKNSDNMWLCELLWAKPDLPPEHPKEEWWHRDMICQNMTLASKTGNIATVKVLFG